MVEIIPAILVQDYDELKNEIALVRGIVPVVQIDICDGIFVKNKTWPFVSKSGDLEQHFRMILNEQEGVPFWEDIDFELDLMVVDAVQNFDLYNKLGPKRIIFHLEAVGDLGEFKNFLEGMDVYVRDAIQIGIAVNTSTPPTQVFPFINLVDFVQCMGIEKVGFQDQEFNERVIEQIKDLKKEYPDLIISVDGGVNFETAPALLDAGASRLVVGSTVFNSEDIRTTIADLENL